MNLEILRITQRIQALAHTGLHFGKGPFDLERYEELNQLSLELLSLLSGDPVQKIEGLFSIEPAYATTKVDVRAVVIQDLKLLLVQEVTDGKWSLPGGWADIGYSPREIAMKEVKEETGFDVEPVRLLALFNKKCHPHPPHAEYTYKVCMLCELRGGEARESIETLAVDFFDPHALPEMSDERITPSQIQILMQRVSQPELAVWVD